MEQKERLEEGCRRKGRARPLANRRCVVLVMALVMFLLRAKKGWRASRNMPVLWCATGAWRSRSTRCTEYIGGYNCKHASFLALAVSVQLATQGRQLGSTLLPCTEYSSPHMCPWATGSTQDLPSYLCQLEKLVIALEQCRKVNDERWPHRLAEEASRYRQPHKRGTRKGAAMTIRALQKVSVGQVCRRKSMPKHTGSIRHAMDAGTSRTNLNS